jgi:hypothetical protein
MLWSWRKDERTTCGKPAMHLEGCSDATTGGRGIDQVSQEVAIKLNVFGGRITARVVSLSVRAPLIK